MILILLNQSDEETATYCFLILFFCVCDISVILSQGLYCRQL